MFAGRAHGGGGKEEEEPERRGRKLPGCRGNMGEEKGLAHFYQIAPPSLFPPFFFKLAQYLTPLV